MHFLRVISNINISIVIDGNKLISPKDVKPHYFVCLMLLGIFYVILVNTKLSCKQYNLLSEHF